MHKNILFGSLTLLFLIAMACTRVVCPEPDERPSCQLESSRFYFFDGTYYTETYAYNAAGYITGITDTRQDGGLMSRQEFIYEGNRLLEQRLYDNANKHVAGFHFFYNAGKLLKESYYELKPDTVRVIERTYEYHNGKVLRINEKNLNVNTASYNVFQHYGDNISRIKTYNAANDVLTDDVEMLYDNKPNPFYNAYPDLPGLVKSSSPNNVTKLIEHVRNGQPAGTAFISTYKYNGNGYPTEQHTEYGSKTIHEQSFTYKCR